MTTKVEPQLRWQTAGKHPNGLQATADGLWIIDQEDPNHIYRYSYDGALLRDLGESRARHSSGITVEPSGNIWVASTFTYELILFDRETGREIRSFPTPPYDRSGGAHGTEWRWGQLWFNVPVARRIFVADPETGRVLRDLPAHGDRSHGMAWDPDGSLWVADTNKRVLYKQDPFTGAIRDAVGVAGPEPHGLTIWQGQFWLCDAESRWVFTIPLPQAP
jgi:sugar lactone lactonase YvrE